jgi:UDP-N-acetylglucosamine 1-carboxyvinyltransferase
MDFFRIQGGHRLSGRVTIEGAKNAALPLMAASLLTTGRVKLTNVGPLADIRNLGGLLGKLGVNVDFGDDDTISMATIDESCQHAPYDMVKTMRASICVLGPMLARRGRAVISMPGGCAFGTRPIDLHLRGLAKLGAKIEMDGGDIIATADRLKGATVFLGGPNGSTVLGTANVLSAATLAEGRTVIESAACEPEIVDLANMLNRMGAKIRGAGRPRLVIDGVDPAGPLDISADRLVIWTRGSAQPNLDGADAQAADAPLELYMEGNVVFRQGQRVVEAEQRLAEAPPTDVAGAAVQEVITTDGVKLRLGPSHWLMLRFSGTEPLLRVMVEAAEMGVVDHWCDPLAALADQHLNGA